jgi:hypothetical protein
VDAWQPTCRIAQRAFPWFWQAGESQRPFTPGCCRRDAPHADRPVLDGDYDNTAGNDLKLAFDVE